MYVFIYIIFFLKEGNSFFVLGFDCKYCNHFLDIIAIGGACINIFEGVGHSVY